MELNSVLPYIQIALSILIIGSVLLQQSSGGLGALGGGSDEGSIKNTRRGSEKFLLQFTIILGILFAATSILALFI